MIYESQGSHFRRVLRHTWDLTCIYWRYYREMGEGVGEGVKLCYSSSSSCALRISSFFALLSRWTMWGRRSRQGSVLQLFLSIPVIGQRWRKNCHHCSCDSANQRGGLPHWYVALLCKTLPSQPFCLDIVIMIEFTTRPKYWIIGDMARTLFFQLI